MLFNSYIFLYVFLPVSFFGYFLLARISRAYAIGWLLAASLFFYGWWDPRFLPLLVGSIVFNYAAGRAIDAAHNKGRVLFAAVAANIALLAWFKYANFFGASASAALGEEWRSLDIILPLGISFFTFTQIAYLVDVRRGLVREHNFLNYGLFVTYFPHLIAGPVLHHKEMMPQFAQASSYRVNLRDVTIGLIIFGIGLFKKVVLADGIQPYVAPVFDASLQVPLTFDEAWAGALAYTLQIYFDFSGYSDMAIGASRIFGIVLPLNFDSPYKAASIIDFWRRWHMTLSRFLRDYLYIPLGGSRTGRYRRHVNLMATMLLGGLWHGANWTFVVWGGLHGLFLVVNHFWRGAAGKIPGIRELRGTVLSRSVGVGLTFLAVVVAWVPFRATDFASAKRVLGAMAGTNGLSLPADWLQVVPASGLVAANSHLLYPDGFVVWAWILIGLLIVWMVPNSQQIAEQVQRRWLASEAGSAESRGGAWGFVGVRESALWGTVGALLCALAFLSAIADSRGVSEFIYFNF